MTTPSSTSPDIDAALRETSEHHGEFNASPGIVGTAIGSLLLAGERFRMNMRVIAFTVAVIALGICVFIALGGNTTTFAKPTKYEGFWSGWQAKNDAGYFEVKNRGIFGGTEVYDHTNRSGTWKQGSDAVMRRTHR